MSFHSFRHGNINNKREHTILELLWRWHDRHPLPSSANRFVRKFIVSYLREWLFRIRSFAEVRRAVVHGRDEFGDPVVPDRQLLDPIYPFIPMKWEQALAWFAKLHEVNEFLRRSDGSWVPQPYANYANKGVPIEDVALRILGYVGAYRATNDNLYIERAQAGAAYLLKKRQFADGHLLLQGHTVIDTTYTFAGLAFISLWEVTGESNLLAASRALGDHLMQYQIAGSINHAATPAQLLGPLYRYTGDEHYLRNAVKRIKRAVLPYQLPYGGWPSGHESWTWYHGITTKSVVRAYVAMPFTLEHVPLKDRMASCIYRALNRFITSQRPDGSLKPGRGAVTYDERDEYGSNPREQWVHFIPGTGFRRAAPIASHEFYCYELDALCNASVELPCREVNPIIEGLAAYLAAKEELWRPEFNTMAAGAYLYYRSLNGTPF
jgi:hypothetical protein